MSETPTTWILPAEFVGMAFFAPGEMLRIGTADATGAGVVELRLDRWTGGNVGVYVRRRSDDLSIIEVHMASHDGLAQEELDEENAEAERYPLGPKEYWRAKQVGKYTYGLDGHLMTDEEFEADWDEGE